MGSRQLPAAFALLTAALLAVACDGNRPADARDDQAASDEGSGAPEAGPTGEASGTGRSNGTGETNGLVGTDVRADEVAISDTGPPAPTVVFTASIKGYTEPCGCTLDLVLGGIDRVAGSIAAMRALAPASIVLDAGNTLFEHAELHDEKRGQEVRKTEVLAAALRAIGTSATVPGVTDLALGASFYRHVMASAGVPVLAANLALADGSPFGPASALHPVGDQQLGVIGAVDPDRFAEVADVVASPVLPAVAAAATDLRARGATTVVLLFQGDIVAARAQLATVTDVDFVVIGADPRNTDEIERVGSAWTLEAYDQGRTVGRLKLFCPAEEQTAWTSARTASTEESERLDRVIAGIEEQLAGMPTFEDGTEPPIVARQRARLADLRAERAAIDPEQVSFDGGGCRFLYEPVPMVPGYPTLPEVTEAMRVYNRSLAEINLAAAEPPPAAEPGAAAYTGDRECVECHVAEGTQWATTAHAHAWQTLTDREKQFDRSCVGCHVTGYEMPGGSAVGHTDLLANVQCEQCHGPGSLHVEDPSVAMLPGDDVAICTACHNSEHSPRFDYPAYLPRVLGPGHGRRQ